MRVWTVPALIVLFLIAPSARADAEIRVGGDEGPLSRESYAPTVVEAQVGDRVVWHNVGDQTPHTVTGDGFDSSPNATPSFLALFYGPGGAVLPNATFTHAFEQPGAFIVRCKLHRGMIESVFVENASGPARITHALMGSGDSNLTLIAFEPSELVVHAGDTVVWTNSARDEIHTVTGFAGNATVWPLPGDAAFDSSPSMTPEALAVAGEVEHAPGGFLLPGASFAHVFTQAGTFPYACKLHAGMRGTIIVRTAANRPASVNATGAALAISALAFAHLRRKVKREK